MGRSVLLASPSGLVEDVTGAIAERRPGAEGFSPDFQIALPYRGVFIWHVGHDDVVGDANQVLFITGGEAYRVSAPRGGPYAEVILTPSPSVLSEMTERASFALHRHPLFRFRHSRATPIVQRTSARLRHSTTANGFVDPLAAEEVMLELLRAALHIARTPVDPSLATRRLIRRTKEYLDATFTTPLRAGDIAKAVGATSTYLTDVFRRFEGIPLHRYVTQLRLARALAEIPWTDDFTKLAIELGFSSHSHFTLVFRRTFGCTPSSFRSALRRRSALGGLAVSDAYAANRLEY